MNTLGFKGFEISKSKQDQVKGGRRHKVESIQTGSGINGTNGETVQESIVVYDDGCWQHYYQQENGTYIAGPMYC